MIIIYMPSTMPVNERKQTSSYAISKRGFPSFDFPHSRRSWHLANDVWLLSFILRRGSAVYMYIYIKLNDTVDSHSKHELLWIQMIHTGSIIML